MEKVFEIYIRTTPSASGRRSPIRAAEQVHVRRPHQLGSDARLALRDEARVTAASPWEKARTRSRPAAPARPDMVALWSDDVKSEGTSRITWEIEPGRR